jgi:hypothetical protein
VGTALSAAASAAALAGSGLTAAAAVKQGNQQKMLSEFNARELERAGQEDKAAGIRKAQERRLHAERVMSEQRANAAKSGAGTTGGEGYIDLIDDTAQRAQYLSDLEIATGEAKAAGREGQAAVTRWQGENAARSGRIKAFGAGIDAIGGALSNDDLLDYVGAAPRPRKGRYY